MIKFLHFLENRYGRKLTIIICDSHFELHAGYMVIKASNTEELVKKADDKLTVFDSTKYRRSTCYGRVFPFWEKKSCQTYVCG